jgi:hypothetical protein
MDENLINQTTEEYDVTEDVETEEIDIPTEDIEHEILIEETVYDIIVEPEDDVVIDVSEGMGWTGGDSRYHDSLLGIDFPNQHPITAIGGLRAELDEIERLKTVYSDKPNIANYYEWKDAAYDEYGYFVSLVPNTSKIDICNGTNIFGVSVESAGFIGAQDANVPKNNTYGLIVTSGLVDVRCELDVEVGDYVVSNAYGYAAKSNSNYGYRVLAQENKNGVEYAVIMLGVQADTTNILGVELDTIQKRVGAAETNIISVTNTANQAYKKSIEASESSSVSAEAVKDALDAILNAESNIKEFEQVLESTNNTAVQARAIADSAVVHATTLKNEAVNRANDAWAKADKVETEAYSLCAKIDKYSVGEYSQAYGLTWEQAQSILEPGMIYVPTKHIDTETHIEQYSYIDESEKTQYKTRQFTPGFLYRWDYLPTEELGWVTIDKNYISTDEQNVSAMAVYFSVKEPTIGANDSFGYWYTDGDEIEAKDGNVGVYEPYTLYKWEDEHWLAVATLKGNVNNRAISEVYQTTNQISLSISDARGSLASIDERLTDTESKVTSTTQWTKGSDEKGNALLYNLATIEQQSDDGGSNIVLAVADMDGNKVLNGARIVLGQDNTESYFYLDADRIDFKGGEIQFDATNINFDVDNYEIDATKISLNGYASFTTEDEHGYTVIHGANIATGTLSADKITVGILKGGNYDYTEGETYSNIGTAFSLDEGWIRSKEFAIDEYGTAHFKGRLSATQVQTGKLQSLNYDYDYGETYSNKGTMIDLDEGYIRSTGFAIDGDDAYFKGHIESNSGHIGGYYIDDYALYTAAEDGKYDVGMCSYIEDSDVPAFWAGCGYNSEGKNLNDVPPFYVKHDGYLHTEYGDIGGWQLSESQFGTNYEVEDSIYKVFMRSVVHENGIYETTCFEVQKNDTPVFFIRPTGEVVSQGDRSITSLNSGELVVEYPNLGGTKITPGIIELYWESDLELGSNPTAKISCIYDLNDGQKKGLLSGAWQTKGLEIGYNDNSDFMVLKHGSSQIARLMRCTDVNHYGAFMIYTDNQIVLSTNSGHLYGTWCLGSSTVITSDESRKHDIELLDSRYDVFFDNLASYRFKYDDGTSDRYHSGYTTQNTQLALKTAQIDEKEFAGICTINQGTENEYSGLRYEEFIPLNTWQIQKLKARVAELEAMVTELKTKLD